MKPKEWEEKFKIQGKVYLVDNFIKKHWNDWYFVQARKIVQETENADHYKMKIDNEMLADAVAEQLFNLKVEYRVYGSLGGFWLMNYAAYNEETKCLHFTLTKFGEWVFRQNTINMCRVMKTFLEMNKDALYECA